MFSCVDLIEDNWNKQERVIPYLFIMLHILYSCKAFNQHIANYILKHKHTLTELCPFELSYVPSHILIIVAALPVYILLLLSLSRIGLYFSTFFNIVVVYNNLPTFCNIVFVYKLYFKNFCYCGCLYVKYFCLFIFPTFFVLFIHIHIVIYSSWPVCRWTNHC